MNPGNILSMALSVGAALSSVCMWVVQRRREAPRLRLDFGRGPLRWGRREATDDENTVRAVLELELIVTNLSALPDVLTGLRLRARSQEAGWRPVSFLRAEGRGHDYTRLPIALAPRTTARLFLLVGVNLPASADPQRYFNPPLQLEATLTGLGDRTHQVCAVAAA
jgi:hypothetical protein